MSPRRQALTVAAGGFTLAAALCASLLAVPAQAVVSPVATCTPATGQFRSAPGPRQHPDTPEVTAADLAALPNLSEMEGRAKTLARSSALRLPATVVVPVYVHVIRGTHAGEKIGNRALVTRTLKILRRGFAGLQQDWARRTRYTFHLKGLDYTRYDRWYHAYNFNAPDRAMKHHLHRGGKNALNLYINGAGPSGSNVLGWARFPWQFKTRPRWDSVSVNINSLPGGKLTGYNLGDTVIHETGHWMGLFHTFEGGCQPPGDLVDDTAPEAQPSYKCQIGRDTCLGGPKDDIQNFMDYSLDSCMRYFRLGQIQRMDAAWAKWRQP